MSVVKIPIVSKGEILYITVDESDFPAVNRYRWATNKYGYAITKDGHGKTFSLARYIMGFPEDKEVDHVNRDKLDNRRRNLRLATRAENVRNSVKQNAKELRGVTQRSDNSDRVAITVGRKQIRVGGIRTAEEAAKVYNKLARKYHKEFAVLNDF